MKAFRKAAVLDVIDREAIHSQEELRRRLETRGFHVTQATLSRDIKELGLVKRAADGAYQRPGAPDSSRLEIAEQALRRAVGEYLRSLTTVEQLIVLKTDAGQAQLLAIAMDRAALPDVAGTIAGDDTILVVGRSAKRAAAVAARLERWAKSRRTAYGVRRTAAYGQDTAYGSSTFGSSTEGSSTFGSSTEGSSTFGSSTDGFVSDGSGTDDAPVAAPRESRKGPSDHRQAGTGSRSPRAGNR